MDGWAKIASRTKACSDSLYYDDSVGIGSGGAGLGTSADTRSALTVLYVEDEPRSPWCSKSFRPMGQGVPRADGRRPRPDIVAAADWRWPGRGRSAVVFFDGWSAETQPTGRSWPRSHGATVSSNVVSPYGEAYGPRMSRSSQANVAVVWRGQITSS